jgi:hypothetical protein
MNNKAPFPVVGIGASPDDLRALEDFFKSVPSNPGMAFDIDAHLAADRERFLAEILARHNGRPVTRAALAFETGDRRVEKAAPSIEPLPDLPMAVRCFLSPSASGGALPKPREIPPPQEREASR